MTAVSVMMTKAEAREAMDAVVSELQSGLSAIERAAVLVSEVDEREGYRALGHRSLAACLAAELHVTRQRAYQVLDEMRGRALLTEAAGESVPVTVRQAREILRRPEVVEQVKQAVAAGAEPSTAYQVAMAEQRAADAYLAAHEPPSIGKRRKGYTAPLDRWRGWCEALEEVAELKGDEPLDLEGQRILHRMIEAAQALL